MSEQADINFEEFVELVHQQQQRASNERRMSIEQAVDRTFASDYRDLGGILELGRAPESDLENRVLREIVQREGVFMLALLESVDAARLPEILDHIQENLEGMLIVGTPMTASQADIIFEQMHHNNLTNLSVYLRKDYCQGFVRAFVGFIQESPSVDTLMLTRHGADDDGMSEEDFQSLFTGILSSSVETLTLGDLRVRGHKTDRIHKILADLICENSTSSIKNIEVECPDDASTFLPGDFSIQLLSRALGQTPAIRNLDMSFRTSYSNYDGYDSIILNRHPWWKRHLGDMDTLPTKLLPLVLEKADTWKCDTSHSHLDVLFFLLKEKSPVLLQNVRRRRIRKRKRYGFDA